MFDSLKLVFHKFRKIPEETKTPAMKNIVGVFRDSVVMV
jgi:hypothetical protein